MEGHRSFPMNGSSAVNTAVSKLAVQNELSLNGESAEEERDSVRYGSKADPMHVVEICPLCSQKRTQ